MRKEYTRFGHLRHHRGLESHCDTWTENYAVIALEIGGDPHRLRKLPEVLEKRLLILGGRCEDCKREMSYWLHQSARDIKDVKSFTRFL